MKNHEEGQGISIARMIDAVREQVIGRLSISSVRSAALAISLLGWCLWQQGGFYDHKLLVPALLIIGLALIRIVRHGLGNVSSSPKSMLLLSLPWLIAVCYGLTSIYNPATLQGTWMQLIRWSSYAAWSFLCIDLIMLSTSRRCMHEQKTASDLLSACEQPAARRAVISLEHVVLLSGIMLAVGSLGALYGYLPMEGSVMKSDNIELSSWGFRLGGMLQYPNTLGAISGAFVVFSLVRAKAKEYSIAYSGLAVLHLIVLLLTESRGSWIMTGAGLCLGAIGSRSMLLKYIKRLLWSLIWAFAGAAATARLWLMDSEWVVVPLILAVGCSVLLPYWLQHQRGKSSSWLRKAVACLAWGGAGWLGLMLVPHQAIERVTGHYATGSARLLFYQDAWRLWQESPWLGLGGDAWRQLFASMQSEPYVGKEVHSFGFDLLLDIGGVGTLIAMVLMAWLIILAMRQDLAAGVAAGVISAHSLIDFDMAYGWVVYLWLAWLAMGITAAETSSARLAGSADQAISKMNRLNKRVRRQRIAAAFLLLPLCVAMAIGTSQLAAKAMHAAGERALAAQSLASGSAAACAESGADGCGLLRASVRLAPADTALRIAVAHRLPPREALALLQEGERYERRGKALHRELALQAARAAEPLQAAAYWEAAVQDDRFDSELRTEAIIRIAALADAAAQEKRAFAIDLAKAALTQFQRYEDDARLAADMAANDKRFVLTAAASQAAASAQLLLYTLE